MDGTLTRMLHGNLHLLSRPSYERLKRHYAGDTLSSTEENGLLNEITAAKDMWKGRVYVD